MKVIITNKTKKDLLKSFSDLLKNVFSCSNNITNDIIIYGVSINNEKYYFLTKKERKNFIKENKNLCSEIFTLEYLEDCAGRCEVIKYQIKSNVILYNAINSNMYEIFDLDKSIKYSFPYWNIHQGSIEDKYNALESFGVNFKNNVYSEKEKVYKKEAV